MRKERERYYITKEFTSSEGDLHGIREKMEPAAGLTVCSRLNLPDTAYEDGKIIIRYVEEEFSFMADYIADDEGRISQVRFDPVSIEKKERLAVLEKQKGDVPDTL